MDGSLGFGGGLDFGFGLCTVPTNSVQLFQVELNSDFGVKSKVSLYGRKCKVVVGLVVWHSGVIIQD